MCRPLFRGTDKKSRPESGCSMVASLFCLSRDQVFQSATADPIRRGAEKIVPDPGVLIILRHAAAAIPVLPHFHHRILCQKASLYITVPISPILSDGRASRAEVLAGHYPGRCVMDRECIEIQFCSHILPFVIGNSSA